MIEIEASARHEILARSELSACARPVSFFGACFPLGMMGSGDLRETTPGDPTSRRYAPDSSGWSEAAGLSGPVFDVQVQDAAQFSPEDLIEVDGLMFQLPVGLGPMLAGARLSFESGRFALRDANGCWIRLPGM
jgi:hypothetical protein